MLLQLYCVIFIESFVVWFGLQFLTMFLKSNFHEIFYKIVDLLFLFIFPSYCLNQGIVNLYQNYENMRFCKTSGIENFKKKLYNKFCNKEMCGRSCLQWNTNYFAYDYPGIQKHICCFLIQAIFYFFIITIFELIVSKNVLKSKTKNDKMRIKPEYHENVVDAPLSELLSQNYFVVKDLRGGDSEVLIDDITFGIPQGDCFGIVGNPDSGKEHILKIACKQEKMSSGNMYIDGHDIFKRSKKDYEVGVSLEIESLLNHLTGKESLEFYANLRGLHKHKISGVIAYISKVFQLETFLNIRIEKYSFHEKKKFSVASALVGFPSLILLDKPTFNLHPLVCNIIWNALKIARNRGCTILLTTRSIIEGETACQNVGILVEGIMAYCGKMSELKEKYSDGLTLSMSVFKNKRVRQVATAMSNTETAKLMFENLVPEAILKVNLPNYLSYYVPHCSLKWSDVFKELERAKKMETIKDYSIQETDAKTIYFHLVNSNADGGLLYLLQKYQ